jgi:hypothetical protein
LGGCQWQGATHWWCRKPSSPVTLLDRCSSSATAPYSPEPPYSASMSASASCMQGETTGVGWEVGVGGGRGQGATERIAAVDRGAWEAAETPHSQALPHPPDGQGLTSHPTPLTTGDSAEGDLRVEPGVGAPRVPDRDGPRAREGEREASPMAPPASTSLARRPPSSRRPPWCLPTGSGSVAVGRAAAGATERPRSGRDPLRRLLSRGSRLAGFTLPLRVRSRLASARKREEPARGEGGRGSRQIYIHVCSGGVGPCGWGQV